uniref:UBC core domain-containing protein n=1 Tax=Meloidogyne incognita TaxID=6306 RepID=A0A914LUB3_MELIC
MGVVDVLKMLISLFYSCDTHNPLIPYIAKQYLTQFEEFEKMARIWTKRYAS